MIRAAISVGRAMIGIYVATKRKKITQPTLAGRSGVAQSRISNLETGSGPWLTRNNVEDVLVALHDAEAATIADLYQALKDAKDI